MMVSNAPTPFVMPVQKSNDKITVIGGQTAQKRKGVASGARRAPYNTKKKQAAAAAVAVEEASATALPVYHAFLASVGPPSQQDQPLHNLHQQTGLESEGGMDHEFTGGDYHQANSHGYSELLGGLEGADRSEGLEQEEGFMGGLDGGLDGGWE